MRPRPRSTCAARSRPGSSSPMRAPTSRAARRCCGAARTISSREIGMLAACGLRAGRRGAAAEGRGAVDRRRTCGARRRRCGPARSTTPTARSSRRPSREAGGEPVAFGAFPDDEAALEAAVRDALARMRHGGALRRHLEGRGRSLAPHRVAARRARRDRARRRAQARQAAVPRGRAKASRSSCCRAFRPRRSSPSTPSSRR